MATATATATLCVRAAGRCFSSRSRPRALSTSTSRNAGIFFDADNVSPRQYERIIAEVAAAGPKPTVMRAYRDCRERGWTDACERLGIEAVHVPSIPRKNSSDLYMTCDMMDMRDLLDTFVVVSNDSDFRHVLAFLRKRGKRTVAVTVNGASSRLAPWADRHLDLVTKEKIR